MAKPDPALLDPRRYPFVCTIEPRFGDLDVNMHINNVAMAGILEDSRVRFHYRNGFATRRGGATSMVASVAIEYLGEGAYPDPVRIACAIEDIGRTSQRLVQLVMQHDRPLAFARTVMVSVSPEGPVPLTAEFVEGAAPWMLRA